MQYEKVAILGATGSVGLHIANELRKRGFALRAVARTQSTLERYYKSHAVERHQADINDPEQAKHALEGCDLAISCIGVFGPGEPKHRRAAHALAAALSASGSRCVQLSSFWSYFPLVQLPLREDHPREGGGAWTRHRRAAEDILLDAGAAIANLPDVYGPGAHTSTLQQALVYAVHGRTIHWIGNTTTERAYSFLPDAAATVAKLVLAPSCFGNRWLIPTAGALTGERYAEIASAILATSVTVRKTGLTRLRLSSLINPPLRRFMQVIPEYAKPLAVDSSRLTSLIGPQAITSYEDGIGRTLEWLRAEARET